jgi:hypothetical protein
VQQLIEAAHHTVDFGMPGARLADVLLDPLGQSGAGPKSQNGCICDGTIDTVRCVATGRVAFNGATSASFVVQLIPPNLAATSFGLRILYGGDCTDGTSSPTAHIDAAVLENAIIQPVLTLGQRVRVIASAINLTTAASGDNDDGTIYAWQHQVPGASGAAAWRTYAEMLSHPLEEPHTVKTGVTVRSVTNPGWKEFKAPVATQYADHGDFGYSPALTVVMMSATGIVNICWAVHFELYESRNWPMPVTRTDLEPELDQLVAWCNQRERVVDGHSFIGFFKKVASGLKQAFRFITKQAEHITPLISAIHPDAGAMFGRVAAAVSSL